MIRIIVALTYSILLRQARRELEQALAAGRSGQTKKHERALARAARHILKIEMLRLRHPQHVRNLDIRTTTQTMREAMAK